MLDLDLITRSYDPALHRFKRGLLREYLQYQILSIIFDQPISRKLIFIDGTCLRVVHQLPRFSEDIDFDQKNLSEVEFKSLSQFISVELEKRGLTVEVRFVSRGAFHCYIKFPDLLHDQGISLQKSEKILIQVDSFDQEVEYQSEIFILNKFEFFNSIRVAPKDVMLAQKLWTITNRQRAKGRDFFDIMFLLQTTRPNLAFLQAKFGPQPLPDIIKQVEHKITEFDFKQLAQDVRPFLTNSGDADRLLLFKDFLHQQSLQI